MLIFLLVGRKQFSKESLVISKRHILEQPVYNRQLTDLPGVPDASSIGRYRRANHSEWPAPAQGCQMIRPDRHSDARI